MAKTEITVVVTFKWWHWPVYRLMKICVLLGWEFSEAAVESFVEKSTRLEFR